MSKRLTDSFPLYAAVDDAPGDESYILHIYIYIYRERERGQKRERQGETRRERVREGKESLN